MTYWSSELKSYSIIDGRIKSIASQHEFPQKKLANMSKHYQAVFKNSEAWFWE